MGTTTGFRKFVLIKTRIYENRKPKCGDLGLNFVQDGLRLSQKPVVVAPAEYLLT